MSIDSLLSSETDKMLITHCEIGEQMCFSIIDVFGACIDRTMNNHRLN